MKKIILFIFLFLPFYTYPVDISKNEALSLKEVNLLKLADEKSEVLVKIPKNQRFIIIAKSKNYINLEADDGLQQKYYFYKTKINNIEGWVIGKYIGINIDSDFYEKNEDLSLFKKYNNIKGNLIKNDEISWFCIGDYSFDILRDIKLIISNKDNNYILNSYLEGIDNIKRVDLKDIVDDDKTEVIIEYNFQGVSDPTNGSYCIIYFYNNSNNEFKVIFDKKTFYVSHTLTILLSSVEISKNKIKIINFENAEDIPDSKESEVSKDIDKDNFEYIYEWKNNEYKLLTKKPIEIICEPNVKTLKLRKEPKLESEQIGLLKENENAKLLYIPWMAQEDEYIKIDNHKGLWVNLSFKGINGYAFSYYLDFGYDFLDNFLKADDSLPWNRAKKYLYVTYK